jgi:catechol 2,3-dioxygenase-like lactoylglutathione lyase family enzyme
MSAVIHGLDHWAITTSDPVKCTAFYEGVLGLKSGDRPKMTFEGLWFYADDRPIVHVNIGEVEPGKTGAFDHIAFAMTGLPQAFEQVLSGHGVAYTSRLIDRTGVYQIRCEDPDGCGVELNFQPAAQSQA